MVGGGMPPPPRSGPEHNVKTQVAFSMFCVYNFSIILSIIASKSIVASMLIVYLIPDTRMRADPDRIVSFIPVSECTGHSKCDGVLVDRVTVSVKYSGWGHIRVDGVTLSVMGSQ